MNIPKKIRIGSVDYEVVLTDENLVLNGREVYAWIDYNYHLIKINRNLQDKQGQEQTFLHELMHGIVKERSLEIGNCDEETLVEELAIGLHQVIRDNPGIFLKNEG